MVLYNCRLFLPAWIGKSISWISDLELLLDTGSLCALTLGTIICKRIKDMKEQSDARFEVLEKKNILIE